MSTAKKGSRLLILGVLLLILAGFAWLKDLETAPTPASPEIQVMDTSRQTGLRPTPAPNSGPTQAKAAVRTNPPEPTPAADHFADWLSVSPVQRKSGMSPEAMAPYDTILASLHLSPDRLLRLQELIVERRESAQNAESLSKDERLSPENTALLHRQAEADFDQELAEIAGEANAPKVLQMLSLEPQLAEIVQTIGQELALTGKPLKADQTLQLAQIYKDIYAPATEGLVDRTAGYDPRTGLAATDRQTLDRAASILTPAQFDLLEANLAKTTAAYANGSR